MTRRALQLFAALFTLALVTACASTLEATADFDQNFDFSGVRKIAIQPVERASLSAIRISDMQISRIDQALITELERKGFQVVSDNREADLLLTWHLVTEERTDVRSLFSALEIRRQKKSASEEN